MDVKIIKSKDHYWYKDAIGKVFDANLRVHPTFGYEEYILINTDRNKRYFDEDKLSLLVLKSGHYGIEFDHGEVVSV